MDKIIKDDIKKLVSIIGKKNNFFVNKSILITGGSGFLGLYLVYYFAEISKVKALKKFKLSILDIKISNELKEILKNNSRIKFLKSDVTKKINLNTKFDIIIHAAGIASPFYYKAEPLKTFDISVNGTRHMLNKAKKDNAHLIYFSSSEIYGNPDRKNIPTLESYQGRVSSTGPRSCYDESKRAGETLCMIYKNEFGVKTNIIRPFNVYGPGMMQNDFRILPTIADKILKNQPIKIYGSGRQTRTYCYIRDFTEGVLRTIIYGIHGEIYNIGNDSPELSLNKLVSIVKSIYNEKKIIINKIDYPDSYPGDEPLRRCPELTKAKSHLKYEPKTSIKDGLKKFFNWTNFNFK